MAAQTTEAQARAALREALRGTGERLAPRAAGSAAATLIGPGGARRTFASANAAHAAILAEDGSYGPGGETA